MLLSGQAQGDAAGDLNQEQIPLLPSKSQIKQKRITVQLRLEGNPKHGWLWVQTPGCSGRCPVEFWNLPRTESCTIALGKLRHCLQVRKFFPVQSWNIFSESLWRLLLLPWAQELLGSWLFLVTLARVLAGRCWVLSEMTSSPGWTRSPSLSSQGKCSSPGYLGALCSTCPGLSTSVLCWGGPKLKRLSRSGQRNEDKSLI